MKGTITKMYWERYIDRRNPRRIEPLDKPIDTYIMLDTETTGLNPEEGATRSAPCSCNPARRTAGRSSSS